jgi:hypothetical protein
VLPDVAESAYLSQLPLLEVAHCFWVLRAQWCQKWCQNGIGYVPALIHLIAPERISATSVARYGMGSHDIEGSYVVRPRIVFAWTASGFPRTATRWVFS